MQQMTTHIRIGVHPDIVLITIANHEAILGDRCDLVVAFEDGEPKTLVLIKVETFSLPLTSVDALP